MNGNGFKIGGMSQVQRNVLRNCVSYFNKARGFDQNNNTGGNTILNSTAYKNGTQNYSFGGSLASGEKNVFTNNISLSPGSADAIANATSTTNTWNGISVAAADFLSTDTSISIPDRNDDGSIPPTKFLRLAASSALVDAGTRTNLAFQGKAPDLGAFETGAISSVQLRKATENVLKALFAHGWHVDGFDAKGARRGSLSIAGSTFE